ncbi:hypothetical protein MKW98_021577 [Papaver atlanticum]|uniref:Uncharacterized protein n=1 Tax=Papaver atlanticum TaxID=357466 RepID=A0AAD4XV77_9MAGN|nr:hypothetical protein MKW98_021577 [Papaver atlanticum]
MDYQQMQTGNSMEIDLQSNSMEVDGSVGVLAQVVKPIEDIYPVPAATQTSDLTGVEEAVAEVAVSSAPKQDKFPGAGQLYEEVFAEEKKLQEALAQQDQAKARVIEAEQQLILAKEQLADLETKIPPLLMAKQNFQNKCGGPLLLFNAGTNLSPVTAPIQEDATRIEEPMADSNSETVPMPFKEIVRKTLLASTCSLVLP